MAATDVRAEAVRWLGSDAVEAITRDEVHRAVEQAKAIYEAALADAARLAGTGRDEVISQ